MLREDVSNASAGLESREEELICQGREEADVVTLDRYLRVTAGFTHATVRGAMVRAFADLRLCTADFTLRRQADYDRFYRAVLNRLP